MAQPTTTPGIPIEMETPGKDHPSHERLIARYSSELVNQALSVLGSIEDAEDVVQDTFCEALKNPEQLASVRSLRAWLRTINRSNILDHLRNKRFNAEKPLRKQRDMQPKSATTGGFTALEWREFFSKSMEALPVKMRTLVVLRFWENLSFNEIEERTSIPRSTVCRTIYQATQLMYEKLKGPLDLPDVEACKPLTKTEQKLPDPTASGSVRESRR